MLAGTEIPEGGGWGENMLNAALSPPEWFYIKTDSAENHFNVSFIVRGKVTRQCPQTITDEEKARPNRGLEPTSS